MITTGSTIRWDNGECYLIQLHCVGYRRLRNLGAYIGWLGDECWQVRVWCCLRGFIFECRQKDLCDYSGGWVRVSPGLNKSEVVTVNANDRDCVRPPLPIRP